MIIDPYKLEQAGEYIQSFANYAFNSKVAQCVTIE